MNKITRRSFIKSSATTAAATLVLPKAWYSLARAGEPAYFEREFSITDSMCQKVLAKALSKGGDFGELYFEHTISNWIMLEDGKVNRAYGDIALGVGIRTVKGDQVGYGFTQELTEESMLAAASTAATIANSNPNKPAGKFVTLKLKNYYPLEKLLTAVPLESKLPLVETINEKCNSLSPLVAKVSAGFHDQQKRIMVVTSDGIKAEDLQPKSYLYASVVAEKDGKRERAFWNYGGRRDFSFYTPEIVEDIAKKAVDKALILFDAVQPPAGEMPVVLGHGVTGILLHEAITAP